MAKKLILKDEELNRIITLYNNGVSLRELENITGYSRKTLSKILKEHNVVIKDNTINSRKYELNEEFFKKIDTKEKAYWLGFMAADGYITSSAKQRNQRFGATLSIKDKEHLENFKNCLNATYEIKEYNASEGNYNSDSRFCRLLMTSQKSVDYLKQLGIVENKTLILQFPTEEQVPEKYIYDYIRGYMDGDGSICFSNNSCIIGFTGQKDFLLKIQEKLGVHTKLTTKDNMTYQFNIGGNTQCKKILDKLYKGSKKKTRLDRKYKKYLELKKYTER